MSIPITKDNSIFNKLPIDYNSHSLEKQINMYHTELLFLDELCGNYEDLPPEEQKIAHIGAKYRILRDEKTPLKKFYAIQK